MDIENFVQIMKNYEVVKKTKGNNRGDYLSISVGLGTLIGVIFLTVGLSMLIGIVFGVIFSIL